MSTLVCPNCGVSEVKRVKREGFLQKKVFPKLGRYPWQCTSCLAKFVLVKRAIKKSRSPVVANKAA